MGGTWFKNCMSDSEYNLVNQMPISECYLIYNLTSQANSIYAYTKSDMYFNSEWYFKFRCLFHL